MAYEEGTARTFHAFARCAGALQEVGWVKPLSFDLVGSMYIVGEGQDIDVLVLVQVLGNNDIQALEIEGWEYGGSIPGEGCGDNWISLKKKDINLLVTSDKEYYDKWITAAEVCKYLQDSGVILTKQQRVSVHSIIMDDSAANVETKGKDYWG